MESFRIGIAAPDIVCICVDSRKEGGISGKSLSLLSKRARCF